MTFDRIGKYTVLGSLGEGAHSKIFHIRRQIDTREYALKMVPIENKEDMKFLDQAKHEFEVNQLLQHANIIKIFCLEIEKNWLFQPKKALMLIEYIHGKTLDVTPPLPMDKMVPIFWQIASGMVHMHRRGIYHADLKPNNILFGKRSEVKIIDFGLALIKGKPSSRLQGTPEYMAPETVRNKVINSQTEIFNFGATLYRLITLKLPINAMAFKEIGKLSEKNWKQMLKPIPEFNSNVPDSLTTLVHSCLEYDPQKRPQSMIDIRDRLAEISNELGNPIGDGTNPEL